MRKEFFFSCFLHLLFAVVKDSSSNNDDEASENDSENAKASA